MKRLFVVAASLLSVVAFADDALNLGTKKDPMFGAMPTNSGVVSPLPVVQLLIALAIVLGLVKFVMPKMIGKVQKKMTTKLGSQIIIEESAQFAGGTLYIVNVKAKSLLLSVTQQGVNCIADITENTKPEPTFAELVEDAPAIPDFVFRAPEAPEPTPESIEIVLNRLAQLGG